MGRFKSVVFRSLGYAPQRWQELDAALRELATGAEAEIEGLTGYGRKYRVTGVRVGPAGRRATIVSVWIVLHGEAAPRFITAYPAE